MKLERGNTISIIVIMLAIVFLATAHAHNFPVVTKLLAKVSNLIVTS